MANDAIGSGESLDDHPDVVVPEPTDTSTVAPDFVDPPQDLDTAQQKTDEATAHGNLDEFEPDEPDEDSGEGGYDETATKSDSAPRAAPKQDDHEKQEAAADEEVLLPAEDVVRATAVASRHRISVHRAGATAVGDTVAVEGTDEPDAASGAAPPPRPPDDPTPPVAGPGDEGEPEDNGDSGKDNEPAAEGRVEQPRQREGDETADASEETEEPEVDVYTTEQVAQLFGVSYSAVRDIGRRSDSLLSFHNAPEGTGQRYSNYPALYINALKDFKQQNDISSFKKAADQYAQTLEGQSLAQGLKAEREDKIREYEKAQDGYLTPAQAGEVMNVSLAYLMQHDLLTDIPTTEQQTDRIETFVRPRGVSAETVRQTMEWVHPAYTNPIEAPDTTYPSSSDVEKELGCSRRAVVQMANNGYIPNWRFDAESGRSNRRYAPEYVKALGEHLRTHTKQDLIEAAEQFAHAHPNEHTKIRGQFELGLQRLAHEGDGYIPREQLASYLHLPQGQFWRSFGPKPDDRGYPLQYVRDRIKWSGTEIVDRERATVDVRGRTRWQVIDPGIKSQILSEVAGGSVPTDVARSHGIPPRTVLGWVEAGRRAEEAERARQPGAFKERLARTFGGRRAQQEHEVSEAGKEMRAESVRQIIVDSRPTAKQFVRWVADHEQAIKQVAASRDDIDQRQVASQIALAGMLAEQHRLFPADMLMFAKVFEDLKPFVQSVPTATNENPAARPVLSARQIAALRIATDLAHKGRLSYFPEAGV